MSLLPSTFSQLILGRGIPKLLELRSMRPSDCRHLYADVERFYDSVQWRSCHVEMVVAAHCRMHCWLAEGLESFRWGVDVTLAPAYGLCNLWLGVVTLEARRGHPFKKLNTSCLSKDCRGTDG